MTRPPLHVAHLTSAHRAYANRIFHKEARALRDAGYAVSIVAPHPRAERREGIDIVPVTPSARRPRRFTITVADVYAKALALDADLYHFHDAELLPAAVALKVAHGKRVVYDVHEQVPDQVRDLDRIPGQPLRTLLAWHVDRFERAAATVFDGVIGAIPGITRRFEGLTATETIRNLVRLSAVDDAEPVASPSVPALIYAGTLTPQRGIRELVEAVSYLEHPAELWLLGDWWPAGFRDACRELPGWKRVVDVGYVAPEQVPRYLKAATVGMHMVHPISKYRGGLAVKVLEYMASGLPFVVTDDPYKRDQFGEVGLFADPRDPASIAASVDRLLGDAALRRRLGRRARALAERAYSWEVEQQRLVEFYDRILHRGAPSKAAAAIPRIGRG